MLNETCEKASAFLQSIFDGTDLRLRVSTKSQSDDCILDVDGPDAEFLQAEGGELLEALQHLLNQIFARSLSSGQRLICDVHGFRATREAELRQMAHHAAERVRTTRMDFVFGPMNPNERRIIHLTLANSEDLLTESIGQGSERKLRVGLRHP